MQIYWRLIGAVFITSSTYYPFSLNQVTRKNIMHFSYCFKNKMDRNEGKSSSSIKGTSIFSDNQGVSVLNKKMNCGIITWCIYYLAIILQIINTMLLQFLFLLILFVQRKIFPPASLILIQIISIQVKLFLYI